MTPNPDCNPCAEGHHDDCHQAHREDGSLCGCRCGIDSTSPLAEPGPGMDLESERQARYADAIYGDAEAHDPDEEAVIVPAVMALADAEQAALVAERDAARAALAARDDAIRELIEDYRIIAADLRTDAGQDPRTSRALLERATGYLSAERDLRALLSDGGNPDTGAAQAHECSTCQDCIHDGKRCCGCYDGACCVPQGDGGESRG